MKIKYAITSCNDNPLYYEFWPVISKVWSEFINIEPILVYIGDKLPDELENNKYGQIILCKPLEGIPTSTQSQFIRLWYPQLFPEDICITTDIDMIPLSKWYFNNQLNNINDNEYVALRLDGWDFSICYNVAKGMVFKERLNLDDDFEKTLRPFYENIEGGEKTKWFTDEIYLKKYINTNNVKTLVRKDVKQNRIDRNFWSYEPSKVKLGMYYDCHSVRPYNKYKNEIDKLIKCIL